VVNAGFAFEVFAACKQLESIKILHLRIYGGEKIQLPEVMPRLRALTLNNDYFFPNYRFINRPAAFEKVCSSHNL
jgi:hypothetical protein